MQSNSFSFSYIITYFIELYVNYYRVMVRILKIKINAFN